MKNTKLIQQILGAYSTNYNLLLEAGLTFCKPVALVVDSIEDGIGFAKTLSQNPVFMDPNWSLKSATEELLFSNSEAIIWIHPQKNKLSQKTKELINLLLGASKLGQIGKEESNVAIYMVFESIVPEELRGQVFEIHLPKIRNHYCNQFDLNKVLPSIDKLETLFTQLSETNSPVKAATLFIKKDTDVTEEVWNMMTSDMAIQLTKLATEYSKQDLLGGFVIDEIRKYFTGSGMNIVEICNGELTEAVDFEKTLLIEGNTVFLREKAFTKAVASLTQYVPIEAIKSRLLNEGYIQTNGSGYTVQKWLRVAGSKAARKRFIALNIDDINKFLGSIL